MDSVGKAPTEKRTMANNPGTEIYRFHHLVLVSVILRLGRLDRGAVRFGAMTPVKVYAPCAAHAGSCKGRVGCQLPRRNNVPRPVGGSTLLLVHVVWVHWPRPLSENDNARSWVPIATHW